MLLQFFMSIISDLMCFLSLLSHISLSNCCVFTFSFLLNLSIAEETIRVNIKEEELDVEEESDVLMD